MLLDKQPNSSRMVEHIGGMGGMPQYLTGMMDEAMENGQNGKNIEVGNVAPLPKNWETVVWHSLRRNFFELVDGQTSCSCSCHFPKKAFAPLEVNVIKHFLEKF